MNTPVYRGRWRAWLQLVRPPNLPTVPGDPLAGFLLARLSGGDAPWMLLLPCVGSVLLLYMGGLVLNDCADLHKDREERPERPLPSGWVHPRKAGLMGALLMVLGIGCAGLAGPAPKVMAVFLTGLILLYDFMTKSSRTAGYINMGLCRGASVVLGASCHGLQALAYGPAVKAAAGIFLFISAITAIASRETERERIGVMRLMVPVYAAACPALVLPAVSSTSALAAILFIAAVLWCWHISRRLEGVPEPAVVSGAIGAFLRGMILIQAAFCALVPGVGHWAAVGLLALWPVSMVLSRRFYAS